MISRPNNRRRRWLLLLLALLFIWLAGRTIFRYAAAPALSLAKPVWALSDYLGGGVSTFASTLAKSKSALVAENQRLTEELAVLKTKLLTFDDLQTENQELRRRLGQSATITPPLVARVISHPWRSPYDVLLLDLGQENSVIPITAGSLVVADQTVAIGTIIALDRITAKVKLFSAAGTELPVRIGAARLPTVARGHSDGNFLIRLPRGVEVAPGELIYTTVGATEWLVGRVGAVDKKESSSEQQIFWRYPLNLNELKWVEIYAG